MPEALPLPGVRPFHLQRATALTLLTLGNQKR